MSLLHLKDLSAFYGTSQALFGVDLDVAAGEVVALMGRNGMGKSTTVKCICRMLPADGEMDFNGRSIRHLSSHEVAALGVGLVPEGRRCFRDLTVHENLISAARPGAWTLARVAEVFPRLRERSGQRAASLSGGEQQMLSIGRALMTNPRLLILDEATEGLAPLIKQEIWDVIARLKAESGLAILVIDKSLRELRAVSDRAVILERGRTVWQGKTEEMGVEVLRDFVGV